MTNEEIPRTMEFFLEQHAQFAANIQRLQEERIRDNPQLTRLEQSFQLLVRLAETTDTRLDRLDPVRVLLKQTGLLLPRRRLTRMRGSAY